MVPRTRTVLSMSIQADSEDEPMEAASVTAVSIMESLASSMEKLTDRVERLEAVRNRSPTMGLSEMNSGRGQGRFQGTSPATSAE